MKTKINKFKLNIILLAIIAPLIFSGSTAYAASSFTDHIWKFANGATTNIIDFNSGQSKIYTNATNHNLRLESAGSIVLNTSKMVIVNNDLTVGGSSNIVGSSSIGGDLTVSGDINVGGALVGAVSTSSIVASATTLNIGANMDGGIIQLGSDGAPTVNVAGALVVAGDITASAAGVDFSGATSLKVPVASTGVACATGTKGSIYYDSDDNHFYGCNGSTYVQLDN